MKQLLRLYFDEKKSNQSIAIYLRNQCLENVTLFDDVEIYYEGGLFLQIASGSFGYYVQNILKDMLQKAFQCELVLDESIKKDLGYYKAQDYKKDNRKNFKYTEIEQGCMVWIGNYYHLFSASQSYRQHSWLYNNKEGNIVFEITPSYPWFFTASEEGEVIIKYSEWLRQYKPYVIRKIKRETIQEWIKQLDELIHKVSVNNELLTCQSSEYEECKKELFQKE